MGGIAALITPPLAAHDCEIPAFAASWHDCVLPSQEWSVGVRECVVDSWRQCGRQFDNLAAATMTKYARNSPAKYAHKSPVHHKTIPKRKAGISLSFAANGGVS